MITNPTLNEVREQGMQFYQDPEVVASYSARNGYPPEAIRFILDSTILRTPVERTPLVLDVGSGTGLLTEGLRSDELFTGRIVALDSSEAMMSAMRDTVSGKIVGSMNSMPFREEAFDVVAFGTSLHWGDHKYVPGELRRILRPGGYVIDIYNKTREDTLFTEILHMLPNQAGIDSPMYQGTNGLDLGDQFTFVGSRQFPNDALLTPDGFFKLLNSIEILKTPSASLADAWESLRAYARNHHEVDGHVTVPFDTFVRIARLAVASA